MQWISEGRPVIVYGDGQQSRDFTYVDDIARGTVAALRPMRYEVINLGSDQPVVLMDAIRLVEELVGKKARIEYEPCHRAVALVPWTFFANGLSQSSTSLVASANLIKMEKIFADVV